MRLFGRRRLASESGLCRYSPPPTRDELGLPTGPVGSDPLSRIFPMESGRMRLFGRRRLASESGLCLSWPHRNPR
jgi:hypothetical protein